MTMHTTDLTYWTPNWAWCEIANPDGKTKTGDRCRFCQETKKRGDATRYRCLIHNEDLLVTGGSVKKCGACLLYKNYTVEQEPPKIGKLQDTPVAKCVKKSVKEFVSMYNQFRKDGYPEFMAIDLATEWIEDQWK